MENYKVILKFEPKVEILSPDNEFLIENFDSGVFAFNEYIKSEAKEDMKNGDGVVYLVINKANNELVSYYSLSASTIHIKDEFDFDEDSGVPKEERREHYSPISSFLINMFAVNEKYQDTFFEGNLVASLILKNIINILYKTSITLIGGKRIILCAVNDAVKFYEKNNFSVFDSEYTMFDKRDALDNTPMYLSLHEI
ncbi:MAG: hypothetical protein ACLR60_03585 [Clostridium paraputrificum]